MARPGRHGLTDDQWSRLRGLLPREKDRSGAPAKISNRQVVHASLWILKTGAPWRDLPRHMGKWNSIYRRYRRWCLNGVWDEVLSDLSKASDDEWHSLDGTIVRAHQDASGGAGGAEQNGIGKSRGGRTTKIHARVDALGHLRAYVVTGGQVHDSQQALPLLNGARACAFIMDEFEGEPLPRSNRNVQFDYDRHLDKERHAVENFFQRIKRYRKLGVFDFRELCKVPSPPWASHPQRPLRQANRVIPRRDSACRGHGLATIVRSMKAEGGRAMRDTPPSTAA